MFNLRKSFKLKVSIILIALILLPLLISNFVILQREINSIKQRVFNENMNLAKNLDKQVELSLTTANEVMEIFVNTNQVKSMDPEQMNVLLKEAAGNYSFMSYIFVMDKQGMKIYNTAGSLGDNSDREYFQKAIKGETNFSDVLISKSTSKPIVVLAKPIKDAGEIVGVIAVSLDLGGLSAMSAEVKPGETGYAFIVEQNGKVIAHPNEELVANMEDVSYLTPVQEVIVGKSGSTEYFYEGEDKLSSYVPIEETGWGIVVQVTSEEAFKEIQEIRLFAGILILIVVIGGLIIAFMMANYITKPLIELKEKMKLASTGDLKAKLSGKILNRNDEFGLLANSYNAMIEANDNIVSQIIKSSKELAKTSNYLSEVVSQNTAAMQEVAAGTNRLAQNSQTDSRATEEGTESFKQVAKGAENVAINAENLNEIVSQTVSVAEKGSKMMEETSNFIVSTAKTAEEINIKLGELENSTGNIGTIVETIIGISEQTNLLALNAAIEAARAGEAGKGFAVVSDEIRKLAEESNKSADNITKILKSIQNEVRETTGMFKKTNEDLNSVVSKTHSTKVQIEDIVRNSSNALVAVEEIASVSEEQSASSEEMIALMENLLTSINSTASTAEQISASTEEQTAATEEINTMANQLNEMAKEFENIVSYFRKK